MPADFQNSEFVAVWEYWLDYRKKLKLKKYAAPEVVLKKLLNDSDGDSDTAIKIIHQSVANNWQGLFPLKPEYANGKKVINEQDIDFSTW